MSSTLLAASTTGFFALRRILTTASSASVMPTVASTTNSTASAALTATSACAAMRSARPRASGSHPPVSTTVKARPFQVASYDTRSRVTPGTSSTTASRRPRIRLTSVDLPTLGRPTTANTGSGPVVVTSGSAVIVSLSWGVPAEVRDDLLLAHSGHRAGKLAPGDSSGLNKVVEECLPQCLGRLPHLGLPPRPRLRLQVHRRSVHQVESGALRRNRVDATTRLSSPEDGQRHDRRTGDQCEVGHPVVDLREVPRPTRAFGVDGHHSPVTQHAQAVLDRRRVDLEARQRDLPHGPQHHAGAALEHLLLRQRVHGA